MAYTKAELGSEFWMLTKGILQDATVDTDEAAVIKRWLEEHKEGPEFDLVIARLDKFLQDGYIDRFESKQLIDTIGGILRTLRGLSADVARAQMRAVTPSPR